MNLLFDIFSWLCGQNPARSFTIAGRLLPFCQRCTGLYLGLALTFILLILSRAARKGLPPRRIIYLNILCMLLMPVFGFHLLDPGPAWRLWSGLIFGHALACLLLPATFIIARWPRFENNSSKHLAGIYLLSFIVVNLIPWGFPIHSQIIYFLVLLLALLALLGVAGCVTVVIYVWIKEVLNRFITKGYHYEGAKP